jgi:hypothetical protein
VPPDDPTAPRDWNALLRRVLAPFRSEAAAFRVLLGTVAVAVLVILLVLLIRALS